MKINFGSKKGYRNIEKKNRFKNANYDLTDGDKGELSPALTYP